MKKLRYAERIPFCKNEFAKKLLQTMEKKHTNLALSADVIHCEELLKLADLIGPEICVLKTHVDILENFTIEFTQELQKLAKKHNFFIFEDRKFADIGNTVKHQYEGGIYKIAEWADITNAHSLPGPGIIQGLGEAALKHQRGLLLLAEMSSKDNLLDKDYAKKTLALAEKFPELVFGFISQHQLSVDPKWIYMTPGVQIGESVDALGQQYNTPEKAIIENGTDIIIVGRGILKAKDPLAAAKEYRRVGWEAYEKSRFS